MNTNHWNNNLTYLHLSTLLQVRKWNDPDDKKNTISGNKTKIKMGKDILTLCGFALSCLAALFTILSFSTSHWLESYEEAQSRFIKLGLWEACFNNFGYDRDNLGKVYKGCDWIFSYDYRPIFDWLNPGIVLFQYTNSGFFQILITCLLKLQVWNTTGKGVKK